jgi:foldase protein PrsA
LGAPDHAMHMLRKFTPLFALLIVAAVVAGCGNEVPSNGVAKVGDTVITKKDFDHWLNAAAKGQQAPGASATTAVPKPPDFTECVNAKTSAKPAKGQKKPSAADAKKQCKQEYDALKQQVVQFLVSAEWIQQEADKRDLKVSDAEVRKQFEDQKKQSFPDDKAYQEFLKSSGMTEEDLLFRVRLDVISNKVREDIVKGKGKVTDADITAYYNKNKKRFAQPERRDLAVVLTKTKSKADQARSALESGDSFKTVAKKYSIDEASKNAGGKLPAVAKGQQEKSFDDAIFKAKKGELTGPVKTQFGYYVFKVTKITPASQQTLAEAKETIRNLLRSQGEQKALDDFVKEFRTNYRNDTKCAKDFVIDDCDNAPKNKEKGPASGGAPQGQPQTPQGGAPQGQPTPQQPQG